MHELDQMTPNQRLNAFMTGQAMDRMLAMPVIVSMSGDVCAHYRFLILESKMRWAQISLFAPWQTF